MDNETHMLFHDIDIDKITRKENRKENLKVIQEIFRCPVAGMSRNRVLEY